MYWNQFHGKLKELGYSGNVNQMLWDFLKTEGYSGQLNGMLFKYLRAQGMTGNINKMLSDFDVADLGGGGGGGYTPTFVDNNKTAYLLPGASNAWTDNAKFTFCALIRRNELSTLTTLMELAGRSRIQINGSNNLVVWIRTSTGGGTAYDGTQTTASMTSTGVDYHIFIQVDLAIPSIVIKINGVDVAMTDTTPITTANGTLVDLSATAGMYILTNSANTQNVDVMIADLWVGDSAPAFSNFYSGTPLNISSVGTPLKFVGNGANAAAWNAAVNSGSATFT